MKTINEEARDKVYGDRADEYGDAKEYMTMAASLWSSYSGAKLNVTDVCVMLAMLKMTRLKFNPNHRDSKVDICGYMEVSEKAKAAKAIAQQLETA
jgi:hypothetical protein